MLGAAGNYDVLSIRRLPSTLWIGDSDYHLWGTIDASKSLDSSAQIREKTAIDDDEKRDEVVDSSDSVRHLKTR